MCEYVVQRAAAELPQSATATLFTVSGGSVLLLGMVGELVSPPADSPPVTNTASVGIGDVTLMESSPFGGTGYTAGSPIGGSGIANGEHAVAPMLSGSPLVAVSGAQVDLTCSGSSPTTQVSWTLWYRPLAPGAYVAAV